ncbi:PH domain-containing protein [Thermoactinospora rubra]|uniref:PH domain-containing protein n=1 Tax=Thermoactinospora rubra TaxID=1088767 RepID=UPI000A0FE323|nr:PH domain-containing protein [Thermoactinospora rubra]
MTALRPPRHRPDPRAVWWWTLQWLVFAAVLAVVAGALWVLLDPWWPAAAGGALTALVLVAAVVAPRAQYRFQRWEVTDQAVYTRKGWLWHTWRVAPMSRVQTVDTEQGPLQRAFGLANVKVTTASAQGAVMIEALDHGLAAELADKLTAITHATPGDAT